MQNRETLKDRVVRAIDPREYYSKEFPGKDLHGKLTCPMAAERHEGGTDSDPSFSVNLDTGAFNCYACGFHGTTVLGYHTDVHEEGNFKRALAKMFSEYVGNTVKPEQIKHLQEALNPAVAKKLKEKRGWDERTIQQYRLGWNPKYKRITIPVVSPAGFVVNLMLHDSLYVAPHDERGKRVTMMRGGKFKEPILFPLDPRLGAMSQDEIWIVEGEPDVLTARSQGINAVTVVGGAAALANAPADILDCFNKKHIILCFHNDKAGQEAQQKLQSRLMDRGIRSMKIVEIPHGFNDIGEYFMSGGGDGATLREHADMAPYVLRPSGIDAKEIHLKDTSKPNVIGKLVRTEIVVQGKQMSPTVAPRKIRYICDKETDPCSQCPRNNVANPQGELTVNLMDPELPKLISLEPDKLVKTSLRLKRGCSIRAEATEYFTAEKCRVIPTLTNRKSDDGDAYCNREAIIIGDETETNVPYTAVAVPGMSKTGESTLVVQELQGTADSISNFNLEKNEVDDLKALFSGSTPGQLLKEIADGLSHNVTRIYKRPDLHIGVDLCYHSPADLSFAGTKIPKGSMELLLIGDTRCGKGQVAEGLANFYDLGKTISGESSSFMGLLGGAAQTSAGFTVVWGAFPLNHKRLVIVDEFSGFTNGELGRLSRIRSEGIAELNKGGINASTRANTRIIWIANPRNGKPMNDFASGVAAIKDLIKAQEDIARFDFAIAVNSDEVDSAIMNQRHQNVDFRFSKDALRKVLLWAWSRKDEHIQFTAEATDYILETSIALSKEFSSSVPLIQAQNARFKIAKMAAAIACRVFSTENGYTVRVTTEHAKTAVAFIRAIYRKPAMGYSITSQRQAIAAAGFQSHVLDEWFRAIKEEHIRASTVEGLLGADLISPRDIMDFVNCDINTANKILGALVRARAVTREHRGYKKTPAFITYLRKRLTEGIQA